MKILYIISGTNLGGATLSFLTLLENVIYKGHTPVLVIPDGRPEFVERLKILNIRYYIMPLPFNSWPKLFGIKRFLGYPYVLCREQFTLKKCRQKLNQIVQLELPEIIHTNVSPLDIGHYAAKRNGIPHIWHIREYCDRDFNIHLFPSKRLYQKKIQDDYSICITNSLQKYFNLTDNIKSFVVYNGVRSWHDVTYANTKQKYFLMASRVSEEKGHERTIRVFSQFCKTHPDYKLIILGDGYDYYMNRCKQLAQTLGLENNVIFFGFQQDVNKYMREARALLVASHSEGFGRMTAEAAFNGCIVIGYNAAGTKEILETTGGYLWLNNEEYYSAMEEVSLLTEFEYEKKITYAQKKARRLFSTESYVEKVCDIYSKAIKRL